jgi:hypothetical protein
VRWNGRLGDHAGLTNFGVNITRIVPGGQSSSRHGHSKQDEFTYVLAAEVDAGSIEFGKSTGDFETLHPSRVSRFLKVGGFTRFSIEPVGSAKGKIRPRLYPRTH